MEYIVLEYIVLQLKQNVKKTWLYYYYFFNDNVFDLLLLLHFQNVECLLVKCHCMATKPPMMPKTKTLMWHPLVRQKSTVMMLAVSFWMQGRDGGGVG